MLKEFINQTAEKATAASSVANKLFEASQKDNHAYLQARHEINLLQKDCHTMITETKILMESVSGPFREECIFCP